MSTPIIPDASYEVLRDTFEKVSAKEVADALGVSLSLVYKWAQPSEEGKGGGLVNPLDRVEALMQVSRDQRLIKWLCHRLGGYFVKNPGQQPTAKGIVPATNEILQQFADLLGAITDSAADHKVTKDESRLIRRHWDELKTITEGFVKACEVGDFAGLREQLGAAPQR